jgi:hypothetical protein
MCNVTFYQDTKSGSYTKTYTAPITVTDTSKQYWVGDKQGNDDMSKDITRIVTSPNTWVNVYSKNGSLTIGQSQDRNLSGTSMDNAIESFQVFDKDPSLNPTNVTFYQGGNYDGRQQIFQGAQNVSNTKNKAWIGDTGDNMSDDISCLITGPQAWLMIYSEPNYGGRSVLIRPSSNVKLADLNVDGSSMKNSIDSFQLYDRQPIDMKAVVNNFVALYPGSETQTEGNYYRHYFAAQDSEYYVYDPLMELTKSNGKDVVKFTLKVQHKQLEGDDYATVTFSMDYEGNFVETIKVHYDMADAAQVPDWMITLTTELAIPVAAAATKLIADAAITAISGGTAAAASPIVNKSIDLAAKALSFCVDHINFVLKAIFKLQDDGGSMYFAPIVGQSIPRLVNAYYKTILGAGSNKLSFSGNGFLGYCGKTSWINDNNRRNPYIKFTQRGYDYECCYPDATILYNSYGALCAAKIIAATNLQQDDYLVVQAGFDDKGNILLLEGSSNIYALKYPSGYSAPTTGVLVKAKDGAIWKCVKGTDPVKTSYTNLFTAFQTEMEADLNRSGLEISTQQYGMVDAASAVLHAMETAVVVS